jgi:hypothetical protein
LRKEGRKEGREEGREGGKKGKRKHLIVSLQGLNQDCAHKKYSTVPGTEHSKIVAIIVRKDLFTFLMDNELTMQTGKETSLKINLTT